MSTGRHDTPSRAPRSQDGWRDRLVPLRGVVLIPLAAPDPRDPASYPTAYVPDRLLLSQLPDDAAATRERLEKIAAELHWQLVPEGRIELADTDETRKERAGRYDWATGGLVVERVRLVALPDGRDPDAWELLTRARRQHGLLRGASLEHLIGITGGFHSTPFHSTGGFHSTPFHSTGWDPAAGASPIDSYAFQGSGGRQPVAWLGDTPHRAGTERTAVRPLVGILDTGCGVHDWLVDPLAAFDVDAPLGGVGEAGTSRHPEYTPDLIGPLDGMVDPVAGHGTFIAGLVHQAHPDADLAPWRVMPPDGIADESKVLEALAAIVKLVEGGTRVDVLSLSFGYYHETPQPEFVDIFLAELLLRIRRTGTVVVCSAGNDATRRPMFPAALGRWASPTPTEPDAPPIDDVADAAPLVSVGALNPGGHTLALFSNTGRWVRALEVGAAVVSTIPRWGGGAEAIAARGDDPVDRSTLDPDDFSAGFAVWSGTSFAAPFLAGRIAKALDEAGLPGDPVTGAARVAKVVAVVDAVAPPRP